MIKNLDWRIPVTAIIALMIMECFALYQGINGTLFSIVIASVAGIGGWMIPTPHINK